MGPDEVERLALAVQFAEEIAHRRTVSRSWLEPSRPPRQSRFALGIDLPGSRLVGAFIARLGLPQTNPINDAMRRRLDVAFGSGFYYAYL